MLKSLLAPKDAPGTLDWQSREYEKQPACKYYVPKTISRIVYLDAVTHFLRNIGSSTNDRLTV
jgi:hypothetical protein